MGGRNPDRLVNPPSPLTALTLAEMHLAGWELRAACNRCRVNLRADLRSMIRVYGPDAVWWGQNPKCPGFECSHGALHYSARATSSGSWVSLDQKPSPQTLSAWRAKRRTADLGPRNT